MSFLDSIKSFFGTKQTQLPVVDMKLSEKQIAKPQVYTTSVGVTGTNIKDGIIYEEYNELFQGAQAFDTYQEMYWSDSTINKTMLSIYLPIQTLVWDFEAVKDENGDIDPVSQEHADFLKKYILEDANFDFQEFLSDCLHFIRDGVSIFEIVLKIQDGKYVLSKLAPRKPKSIEKWETEDKQPGITQRLANPIDGKNTISIPMIKLLVFTFRKEAENYYGLSLLRPIAKSWIAKKNLQNFELIGYENQFVGVRKVRVPSSLDIAKQNNFLAGIANFRAGNDNTVLLPGTNQEYDFEFASMNLGNAGGLRQAVKDYNAEITDAMLGFFMKLGESEKGSYGMAKTNMDFFILGLESVVNNICSIINKKLVKLLIDLNFGPQENYPKLTYGNIGADDIAGLVNNASTLAQNGLIKATKNDEQFLRNKTGMPMRKDEDELLDQGETNQETDIQSEINNFDDGQPEDELDSEIANLEDQLSQLSEDEDFETISLSYLNILEEDLIFREVTPAHAQAISQGLKEYWDKKGRLSDAHKNAGNKREELKSEKEKISKEYERKVAQVQSEMDSIRKQIQSLPKGKASKEQKEKIKSQIIELKNNIKVLKSGKRYQTSIIDQKINITKESQKQIKQLMKARKVEIDNKIKAISDEIKAGKTTLEGGLVPLNDHISKNNDEISRLMKQASITTNKTLKQSIREAVNGLRDENKSIRSKVNDLKNNQKSSSKNSREKISNLREEKKQLSENVHNHNYENNEFLECIDPDFYMQFSQDLSSSQLEKLKKKGSTSTPRPLTNTELKVNFEQIANRLDEFENGLKSGLNNYSNQMKVGLIEFFKKTIENNDLNSLEKIQIDGLEKLQNLILEIRKKAFDFGKDTAANEIQTQVLSTQIEQKAMMELESKLLASRYVDNLTNGVENYLMSNTRGNNLLTKNVDTAVIAGELGVILDEIITRGTNNITSLAVTGTFNTGRGVIFNANLEKIYGFQFSAILDHRTTNRCRSLDGRVVEAESMEYSLYSPPQHWGCRSIWIAIMLNETFKPKITGIPSSIEPVKDLNSAKDLLAPEILNNSPAIQQIKAEIQERKEKLKILEDKNIYPNMQQSHKNRINMLEKSILGK